MLIGWSNTALVQIVQCAVLFFFVLVVLASVHGRLRLPKNKLEPLWDILLVWMWLVYAVVLKIYFST